MWIFNLKYCATLILLDGAVPSYLNNKGVSRRYLIKWDELNRTHHGKVWIKTSSDWRSHSKCLKHFFLYVFFKYYTWYDNNSESKVFFLWKQNVENHHHHILFIDRFFINECFFIFRVLWESPRTKWLAFMTSKRPLVKATMPWSSWQSMFLLEKKSRSR